MQRNNKKLWAGRFKKTTDREVEQYTASISFDHQLAHEDILGSLAHVSMLNKCGLISDSECQQIQQGLQAIAKKINNGEIVFSIEDEDIHMNIERLLTETIGPVAEKLHTARSRNDQVALDMHLYLRQQIIIIVDLLSHLQLTLISKAKEHSAIIFPGYTHLQRAQPIYLADHWLAYVAMLQRDVERLLQLWDRVNISPLGACALAGTTLPIDRHHVSKQLGFSKVYSNTLDAVSDRDFVIEFLSVSSIIMMHLSRLSEELILWSSQEFNFIHVDDSFCTGSSIMPQKKNPDVLELGRGKTGRVYGALFSVLTLLKGLPLSYNKDLQEDKEPVFDVVKVLKSTLAIYSSLLNSVELNKENIENAVSYGYLNATALAEYLVQQGMAFRAAHELVGKIVAYCLKKDCKLEDLSLKDFHTFSTLINEKIYDILKLENIVAACHSHHSLADELLTHECYLKKTQSWIKEKKEFENYKPGI